MPSYKSQRCNHLAVLLGLAGALVVWQAHSQPTLISANPPDGATGVSTTTTIVFTFSEAMDTDTNVTEATFFEFSPFTYYSTTPSWSVGNTVLTCTPVSPFPADKIIYWTVNGQNPNGDQMEGAVGSFRTGTGSSGGGSGTNAITDFSVGKTHHYNQTSSGSPTLDPTTPYGFSAVTSLSSNRTATNVVLTLPTAAVSNLTHLPPPSAEVFILVANYTSLSNFDATFPAGNYSFFVQAASSNQTVVVNLPTTNIMAQPGAPHLTNYPAAQTVNPSQAFVLGWDAFPGGTAADYIFVSIGTNYSSPHPGLPGALAGTAQTFTIPAGTLQPNSTYDSTIGFYHHVGATNANYETNAYRATFTEFSLITGASATGPLILTNAAYAPANFSFDVICSTCQTVTVEYKTNLAIGSWQTLLTTNNQGSTFRAIAPQSVTNRVLFFRAKNGP